MFEQNIYRMVDQENGKEIKQVLDTENNKVIWGRAIPTYDTPIVPTRNAPLLEVSIDGVCRAVDSSLPDGYVELESVVFDGSSYFDTGIVVTSFDYEIESDTIFPNDSLTPMAVWGFMNSKNNNLPRWMTGVYRSEWLTSINNSLPIGTYDSDRHKIKNTLYLENNTPNWTTFIDGTEVVASTTIIANPSLIENNTLSIYIGARNNNGTVGNFFDGTFYGIKIVKDSVLIRNYVALKRLSDNVIVLYDKVNNVILQNLGGGTLTAGNLVHQTPTNSFDIYCNNGAVKWGIGKNLFNVNGEMAKRIKVNLYNTNQLSIGSTNAGVIIPVYPSTQYTIHTTEDVTIFRIATWSTRLTEGDAEVTPHNYVKNTSNTPVTFTTTEDDHYLYVQVNQAKFDTAIAQLQLEKGNMATAYEPYTEGIIADGTPEVLMVAGNYASGNLTGYGTYVSPITTAGNRVYKRLDVPNGTYTCAVDGDYELIVQWRDPADQSVTAQGYENLTGWITSGEVTLNKPSGGYGITVKRTADTSITPDNFDGTLYCYKVSDIQTASVPDLFAVGDYADEAEIISGAVTRRVGVKVLDGTENWSMASTASVTRYRLSFADVVDGTGRFAILCSHFSYASSGQPIGGAFLSSKSVYVIPDQSLTTVDDFKAWLAEQYAAGTPVIVLYPLATETTESITPQSLQGYRGKTIIVTAQSQYASGQNIKVKYLGIDNLLSSVGTATVGTAETA